MKLIQSKDKVSHAIYLDFNLAFLVIYFFKHSCSRISQTFIRERGKSQNMLPLSARLTRTRVT